MKLTHLISILILIGILIFFIYTLGVYYNKAIEKYRLQHRARPTPITVQNEVGHP